MNLREDIQLSLGVPFVKEYPKFGELFEKLFFKRELDEWYKEKCKEKYRLPAEIYRLRMKLPIEDIMVRGNSFPSASAFIDLKERKIGSSGFVVPSIEMHVSKIIPVYQLIAGYTIKNKTTEGEVTLSLALSGSPLTKNLIETVDHVTSIMKSEGYIQLHEEDLYDKICDWDQIPYSTPLGRAFTIEEAVFNDTLDLCD